jgi:hypothetical protein
MAFDPMNKATSLLDPIHISLVIRGCLDIHKVDVSLGISIFLKEETASSSQLSMDQKECAESL